MLSSAWPSLHEGAARLGRPWGVVKARSRVWEGEHDQGCRPCP